MLKEHTGIIGVEYKIEICVCSFGYFPGVSLKSAISTSSLEDGTDRGFRNVGRLQTDAGEIPKRTYTIFKTRRKPEIKKIVIVRCRDEAINAEIVATD